jgi:hypothetical protein
MKIGRRTCTGTLRLLITAVLLCVGTLLSLTSATVLATTPSVIIGVNDGTGWGEPDSLKFREFGFASERLNANPGHTTIAESVSLGWKNDIVIVGNTNDEEELSKVNITKWTEETLAQVKEQAAHGVTLMEVGNEMFLKGPRCGGCYQQKEPVRYAEMFISLSKAVETAGISGVKLLFDSYGDYEESEGGPWSQVCCGGGWLATAAAAKPELLKRVAGFTMHPYGEVGENKENDWGPVALKVEHEQAVSLGFEHTDYYATEFGVQLNAEGPTGSTSLANQAEKIKAVLTELIGYGYVKGIWYYQTHDDGTGKWGLIEPQESGSSPFVTRPALETLANFTKSYTTTLVGDPSTTYSVGDQTSVGREETFQFAATYTGKIEELKFRTNGTANTGVSSVALGVFADSSGKPGGLLGQATVSGEPATNSWVKATGLSINVTSGTKYWLAVLPLGTSGKQLHFNASVGSGGSGNVESVAGGLTSLKAEEAWETFNQGPVGFQAIGSSSLPSAPSNSAVPTISGTAQQGQALSASKGTWSGEPTGYTYQWQRCNSVGAECVNIAGAATSSYTLVEADFQHEIVVKVTADNAGGTASAVSTATSKVKGLVIGDATTSYSVADQTSVGREETFQFTAKATGKVEELQLRTNGTANTGVSSVVLGVFAEKAGKPGEVLGQGTASGEPATNSWVKVTGLSISATSGTKYWLAVLPLGTSGKQLHFNVSVGSGGSGNVESVASGLTSLKAEEAWETYNQGPVGFQGIGA